MRFLLVCGSGFNLQRKPEGESATEYADQKRRAQGHGTSARGAELAKRMAVESCPPQRSQGSTSGNPLVLPQTSQIPELCRMDLLHTL